MDPMTLLALLGAGTSIASNLSSGNKEDAYSKQEQQRSLQMARRNALQSAIGSHANGVINPVKAPDLSKERILGAIGQAAGMVGTSGMGRAAKIAPPDISMVTDDPTEAIRRRLQLSGQDTYGIA